MAKHPLIQMSILHRVPGFDKEICAGPNGSKLRVEVEKYDFASVHPGAKSFMNFLDFKVCTKTSALMSFKSSCVFHKFK